MSTPSIIFGTIVFGFTDPSQAAVVAQPYFDILKAHGVTRLDTARRYGNAEEVIGNMNLESQGFVVDTKVFSFGPGAHKPEKIAESVRTSLDKLKLKKVDVMFLHAPERTTPIEEAVKGMNDLYQQGLYARFGVSNFTAAEVAEVVAVSDKHGWVRPTVYQGNYNAITRLNEDELFPLLRKEKIAFHAYSPLAGGCRAGKTTNANRHNPEPGRMTGPAAARYQGWYFKDSYFNALDKYLEFVKKHNLTPTEVAARWLAHHSYLSAAYGDAIIVGASRVDQLETNLQEIERGPLPAEVAQFVSNLWAEIKKDAPPYHD